MSTEAQDQSGDCPDDLESVEEEETGPEKANRLIDFQNVLSTIQSQRHAELMALLPPQIKKRIKALKALQFEITKIEAKFFKEVHDLECKYHNLYTPLYEKRGNIVNGVYEPTEKECEWPSDEEDEISSDLQEKAKLEESEKKTEVPAIDPNAKGVPDFWLTIFKNVSILATMVQPHDEPVLKHLTDIKAICKEEPMGFTLEFYFSPNEYFSNTVLTKEYGMKCVPEEDDPLSFEGPEIFKCSGCTINWEKSKNVTLKTIKKKQKHKSRGIVRTVTKTVSNDSFFNFFTPPVVEDIAMDDIDDELRHLLTTDFEIGHFIRERIIPKAVLYYTGDLVYEDEEYEEEEEEYEEDSDDNEHVKNTKNSKVKPDENCKQQ